MHGENMCSMRRFSVNERIVDDVSLPGASALAVDRDLVAMPWLDCRHEPFAAQTSGDDVARPALRPRRDQDLRAGTVDVCEAQPVRCRNAIDFLHRPRLSRISLVSEEGDDARAFRVHIREFVCERDLGNAVVVDVEGCRVDGLADARREDVLLPIRVFVPTQLFEAAGQGDDVRSAVAIQVGDDHLIAAGQTGVDRVGDEISVMLPAARWLRARRTPASARRPCATCR